MKTLSQHIEERLIINRNFKQKEYFRPSTAQELYHYINSRVDELIDNDDDEFELPALKTDEEEELISEPQKQKENNSFSSVDLDSIAGESYNINK